MQSMLLRPGESALIIFTRNENLKLDDDGSGRTGEWVINPLRRVDWIVIYNRVGEVGAELNGAFAAELVVR